MRPIAIHTFTPSNAWRQRADQAAADLMLQPTLDDKLNYIKANSAIWKDLGKEFIQHFGNKCWYTDAANYGARLDVEHFRPKAKTVELTADTCQEAGNSLLLKLQKGSRDGYWWLAFHPDNLMLCAQVMNREDKRNFFPLHRDSPVATSAPVGAWRNEIPAFLDPRRIADVCLVTYDEKGFMRPRTNISEWERLRVLITNECFGLSRFQPLVEGRQQVWQKCIGLIERYNKASKKQLAEGVPNPALEQEKNDVMIQLQGMLDPKEPFSSVAACCLQDSPYEWTKALAALPPQPPLPAPAAPNN